MVDANAGTPRWVKVSLAVMAIVVVLFLVLLLFGHGPGRHMPSHGLGNHTATATSVVPSWR